MSEELERSIQLPKSLENIVETDEARYVGRAFGLHFDSGVRGNASLTRYSKSRGEGPQEPLWSSVSETRG